MHVSVSWGQILRNVCRKQLTLKKMVMLEKRGEDGSIYPHLSSLLGGCHMFHWQERQLRGRDILEVLLWHKASFRLHIGSDYPCSHAQRAQHWSPLSYKVVWILNLVTSINNNELLIYHGPTWSYLMGD